jgi:hypothetical protein
MGNTVKISLSACVVPSEGCNRGFSSYPKILSMYRFNATTAVGMVLLSAHCVHGVLSTVGPYLVQPAAGMGQCGPGWHRPGATSGRCPRSTRMWRIPRGTSRDQEEQTKGGCQPSGGSFESDHAKCRKLRRFRPLAVDESLPARCCPGSFDASWVWLRTNERCRAC